MITCLTASFLRATSVSYTHLDVYKRQDWFCVEDNFCIWEELQTMMSIQKPAVAEHSEDRVQDNPFVGKTIVVPARWNPTPGTESMT